MTLTGFPLDSTQIGYHEDGLPAYSSEYSSKNYRDVLAALISDGVIARVGNALKVEFADEQQHMNATASLTMTSGAAVKGGCMCITKGETVSVTAPQITGDETVATKRTAIGIAFYGDGLSESTTADESVEIDVKSSSGQPSYASNALYMAEVISKTVKHSGGTYSYSHEIQDLRASEHCGFSAPFVDIDLSSFYDNVNEAINSYSMEIIENIALLKGWTQTAVELAQDALDGTVAGNIYTRLDALEADGSVTTARIADDAVDNDKLAENAVDTENVMDGSITPEKLSKEYVEKNDTGWVRPIANKNEIKYRIVNGELFIEIAQQINVTAHDGSSQVLFTIPENSRPNNRVFSCCFIGGVANILFLLENGEVSIVNNGAASNDKWVYGSLNTPMNV